MTLGNQFPSLGLSFLLYKLGMVIEPASCDYCSQLNEMIQLKYVTQSVETVMVLIFY